MPIHTEVLKTAIHICRDRQNWTFKVGEVVLRLPHLNQSSVRTHIVSRCCVNAPKNHPHKWDYFERIGRGLYKIRRAYRQEIGAKASAAREKSSGMESSKVGEIATAYNARDTIHATVYCDKGVYIGECLEVSAVTQARTLDELIYNLEEAICLHLEGEDLASLGFVSMPRLSITYEIPVFPHVLKTQPPDLS